MPPIRPKKVPVAPIAANQTTTPAGYQSVQNSWLLLIPILALVLIYSLLPLGTALELGGDEGFELTKGFLCSKGFVLYKQIWCDQPPLYPKLLSWLFQAFGPSILVARLLAAGFGLLLVSVLYQMVRLRTGSWAALAAAFFLLASPAVLQMSVSVMVEVPTIATALLSALLVFQWTKKPHWSWLVASGVVMGLAMEIKVTAIMLAPAILAEIVVSTRDHRAAGQVGGGPVARPSHSEAERAAWLAVVTELITWGAAAGVVFLAIAFMWGGGSLESSWKSHTLAQHVPGLSSPDDFRFDPTLLLRHPECLFGAVAGIALLAVQWRWRELAFPVVMFTTCFLIHTFHRPWWPHYYLHLAVPLAWLSGLAVGEVLRGASELFSVRRSRLSALARSKLVAGCVIVGLALTVSEIRLESTIKKLRQAPRAADSAVLGKIGQYALQTHWIYCQPVVYPFHARLPVPPELAVVVLKRYWSGQITPTEIVEICRRYKPEQVLLWRERIGREWQDFLSAGYSPEYQDTNCVLFVAKGIEER